MYRMYMCPQSVLETIGRGITFSLIGCFPKSPLAKTHTSQGNSSDSLHTESISGKIKQINVTYNKLAFVQLIWYKNYFQRYKHNYTKHSTLFSIV